MLFKTASVSLQTLAAEIFCKSVGYTGLAVLKVDDQLERFRPPKPEPVHASVTIHRGKRRKGSRAPRTRKRAS